MRRVNDVQLKEVLDHLPLMKKKLGELTIGELLTFIYKAEHMRVETGAGPMTALQLADSEARLMLAREAS